MVTRSHGPAGRKKTKDFMNSKDLKSVQVLFVCLSYHKHIFFHVRILIIYVLYKPSKTRGKQGSGYFAI